MSQSTRIQILLPTAVAKDLKQLAISQGRTVSSLGSFLIESALRQQRGLRPPTVD
jgi:hypothetical protein